jgi:uncharacterized membrane protein
LGSLTNTLLVLAGIYFFLGKTMFFHWISYNLLLGIVGTTILTSGIPEAVLGGLTGYGICKPLRKLLKQRNTQ